MVLERNNIFYILLISFIALCYFILNTDSFLQKEIVENFEDKTKSEKKENEEEKSKLIQDAVMICNRYPNGSRCKELKVKEIGLQSNENLHERIIDGGLMSNEMEQYTVQELEKMI